MARSSGRNQAAKIAQHIFHGGVRESTFVVQRAWPTAVKNIAAKALKPSRLGISWNL